EIRPPLQESPLVPGLELTEKGRGRVQAGVVLAPLVDARRSVGVVPGRDEQPVLALVPLLRRPVDPLRRELVDDEERGEPGERVERVPERVHVVEDANRDDRVEWARLVELLERDAAE